MTEKGYISLDKLETYKLTRQLSQITWLIYENLDWQMKKIMGDQFIESTDSVGANIAEGFGRYHYLDKVKFYYNARGSLLESRHWLGLLKERKLVLIEYQTQYLECYRQLRPSLNALINSVINKKRGRNP